MSEAIYRIRLLRPDERVDYDARFRPRPTPDNPYVAVTETLQDDGTWGETSIHTVAGMRYLDPLRPAERTEVQP